MHIYTGYSFSDSVNTPSGTKVITKPNGPILAATCAQRDKIDGLVQCLFTDCPTDRSGAYLVNVQYQSDEQPEQTTLLVPVFTKQHYVLQRVRAMVCFLSP